MTKEQCIETAEALGWTGIYKQPDGLLCGLSPKDPRGIQWDAALPNQPERRMALAPAPVCRSGTSRGGSREQLLFRYKRKGHTMNTTEHNRFTEEVRGEVFGPYSFRVQLLTPRGKVERQEWLEEGADAKAWGEQQLAALRAQLCGNGQPLSKYPALFESIYGAGEWELRIY